MRNKLVIHVYCKNNNECRYYRAGDTNNIGYSWQYVNGITEDGIYTPHQNYILDHLRSGHLSGDGPARSLIGLMRAAAL